MFVELPIITNKRRPKANTNIVIAVRVIIFWFIFSPIPEPFSLFYKSTIMDCKACTFDKSSGRHT